MDNNNLRTLETQNEVNRFFVVFRFSYDKKKLLSLYLRLVFLLVNPTFLAPFCPIHNKKTLIFLFQNYSLSEKLFETFITSKLGNFLLFQP